MKTNNLKKLSAFVIAMVMMLGAVVYSGKRVAEAAYTGTPITFKEGETIILGKNMKLPGNPDIVWQVARIDGDIATLISRDALEIRQFNDYTGAIDTQAQRWNGSQLQAYLNGDFYNNSFTATEKTGIMLYGVDVTVGATRPDPEKTVATDKIVTARFNARTRAWSSGCSRRAESRR